MTRQINQSTAATRFDGSGQIERTNRKLSQEIIPGSPYSSQDEGFAHFLTEKKVKCTVSPDLWLCNSE